MAVEHVVKNPSLQTNKSVNNPQVSMVLNNYPTSNSSIVSQVNNLQLPVTEQTVFPPSDAYHNQVPLPLLPPSTYTMQPQGWMHGWNDSCMWPGSRFYTPTDRNTGMPYHAGNHYTSQFTPYSSPYVPTQSQPFTLCRISGNIKVCAGHRNRYPKSSLPPDDLCIKHQEWCEYIEEGTQVQKHCFGNAYYHFNQSCIKIRFPAFIASQLVIPELDTQKERLSCSFSITIA